MLWIDFHGLRRYKNGLKKALRQEIMVFTQKPWISLGFQSYCRPIPGYFWVQIITRLDISCAPIITRPVFIGQRPELSCGSPATVLANITICVSTNFQFQDFEELNFKRSQQVKIESENFILIENNEVILPIINVLTSSLISIG